MAIATITEPVTLDKENVLSPVGVLPGNVPIESGPAYAKPAAAATAAQNSAAVPVKVIEAPAPATTTKLPGVVFAPTEPTADGTTTKTTTTRVTSTVTVAPPPTPTSSISYYSTEYLTTGRTAYEILWIEDIVTVTEQITATVSVHARDHLHMHKHKRHDH